MPTSRSDRSICPTPWLPLTAGPSWHGAWHRSYTYNGMKRSRSNAWWLSCTPRGRLSPTICCGETTFTVPTDEEVLWVGYDSTHAPTDVWTYWHGRILHTPWPKSQVRIDVQWGKHGSMPRNVVQSDLPKPRTLNFFYAMTIFGEPDILLGDISRKGPLCFCHGYRRYLEFTRPIALADKVDAVVRTEDPGPVLHEVFGSKYSNKHRWP
jgi:hypothetical protein